MPEECSICLESFGKQSIATSKPCGHKYHFECLNTWVKTSSQCPTCRAWLTDMELESGTQYKIERREQSKLDFQPPTPPTGPIQSNLNESGDNAETCITCLNKIGLIHLQCESCNVKFHANCHDGEFCPNCGWNKFQSINSSLTMKRAKGSRNGFDGDENRMYCRIVDELKLNQQQKMEGHDEIDEAWGMLDKALHDPPSEEVEEEAQALSVREEPNQEIGSHRLKKPNSVTHTLTMDALAKHDMTNGNKPKNDIPTDKGLNYIQKLIIYRLLIKPRIPSTIPIRLYTKISKNISRKFYDLINRNKYAMLSLNSLIEFSEREGIVQKDKRSIDSLYKKWGENSIIRNFVGGEYLNNELGQNWIARLINEEISKSTAKQSPFIST